MTQASAMRKSRVPAPNRSVIPLARARNAFSAGVTAMKRGRKIPASRSASNPSRREREAPRPSLGGGNPLLGAGDHAAHRRRERTEPGVEQPAAEGPLREHEPGHDQDRGGQDERGANEKLDGDPAGARGSAE